MQQAGLELDSVHLRTVSALLAHTRLAATYRACLWSIRACTVTSPNSSHIQATVARPHGCKNRAEYVSQRVPTLFSGEFRKLNNEKLTLGMIVDDLSQRLFIATFVFQLCMRDRAVKSAEMAFFTSIYLLQCCLQNRHGENQKYHPKFHLPLLRSAKSS